MAQFPRESSDGAIAGSSFGLAAWIERSTDAVKIEMSSATVATPPNRMSLARFPAGSPVPRRLGIPLLLGPGVLAHTWPIGSGARRPENSGRKSPLRRRL